LASEFRARGWKLTAQRRLLFSLLHGNDQHLSAEALHAMASERMPGISLRTVYQTLGELTELGDLRMVRVDGGAARFDPNLDDHHHAQCVECGTVFDVYVPDLASLRIVGADGFSTTSAHLILSGVCAQCAASHDSHPTQPLPKEPLT
jgi:Fur family ferric uptake transcriptional regulator